MKLDKDTLAKISPAINRTWDQLAGDTMAMYSEPGCGRPTNKGLLELTLDANYISMYGGTGGEEVDKIVTELIKEHSHKKVINWLSRNINLLD